MNSVLGSIQLGGWELGSVISAPVTCTGLAKPTFSNSYVGGIKINLHFDLNSILGLIALGQWELGQIPPTFLSSGCLGKGNPVELIAYRGGISAPFASVLGDIELGLWELGAISLTPFNLIPGAHNAVGHGEPILTIRLSPLSATCKGLGNPIFTSRPNEGALLAQGIGKPVLALTFVFYYPELDCSGSGNPTLMLTPIIPGAAIGLGKPILDLSPIVGQRFSCVVGSLLEVSGEITNGSW